MPERVKNVYFWVGIVGVVFSASGIQPETLTSWKALFDSILSILSNPYSIMTVSMAILGVFVNPTTRGLKD